MLPIRGLALLCSIIVVAHGYGISVEQDLTLTESEQRALEKFRELAKPHLYKDYMHEDIYLIRWLRAKKFNVQQALELLKNDVRWRKENKMDELDSENWDGFQSEYPIYNDGVAKDGKPLLVVNFGSEWDLRRAALSGKMRRVIRWLFKGREDVIARVRQYQAEGKNVTSGPGPQCMFIGMPLYSEFSGVVDQHYPESVDQIILVNVPRIFEIVLNLINPLLSEDLRNSIQTYGSNKNEWQQKLYNIADPDQLPPEFGGTRIYNNFIS